MGSFEFTHLFESFLQRNPLPVVLAGTTLGIVLTALAMLAVRRCQAR